MIDVSAHAGGPVDVEICMSEGDNSVSTFESDISVDQVEIYGCGEATDDSKEDDFLLSVVPTIAAAANQALPPEWGVLNALCCPGSNSVFSLRIDGVTKSSSLPACSAEPSFSGFQVTTAGNKSASGSLSSGACGTFSFDFSFEFEESTSYLFVTDISGSQLVLSALSAPLAKTEKMTTFDLEASGNRVDSILGEQSMEKGAKQSFQRRDQ